MNELHLATLAATIAIEVPIAWAFARLRRVRPLERGFLGIAALINLATQPFAVLCFLEGVNFWIVEAAVLVAEAVAYVWVGRLAPRRAVVVSFAANVPTLVLGIVWPWT